METLEQMKDALERMMDLHQACAVLETFAAICVEKAEHVRTTWQDENLALAWEKLEKRIIAASHTAAYLLP